MAEPLNRSSSGLAIIASCSLALLLAGCDALLGPQSPGAGVPPARTATIDLPPPPPRKPVPPTAGGVPGPNLVRLPPAATATPPETPTETREGLDRLIGLDQPQLANLLGEPRQKAESPPATIWRYVAESCDLDVYFYLDLQSQAMRALHYEVRSHDPTERSAQRCYDDLVSERRANADSPAGSDRPR